jgi:predicted thioesterase
MKDSFRAGLLLTRRIVVDLDRTIDFMGEEGRVYATPCLVRDIEQTCRELILQHMDEGEDSVGVNVNVTHSAPTLQGMPVEITVTVASLEGRRVRFDVTARDVLEEICRGEHTRFIVDRTKTIERLKAKAAKARAAS